MATFLSPWPPPPPRHGQIWAPLGGPNGVPGPGPWSRSFVPDPWSLGPGPSSLVPIWLLWSPLSVPISFGPFGSLFLSPFPVLGHRGQSSATEASPRKGFPRKGFPRKSFPRKGFPSEGLPLGRVSSEKGFPREGFPLRRVCVGRVSPRKGLPPRKVSP